MLIALGETEAAVNLCFLLCDYNQCESGVYLVRRKYFGWTWCLSLSASAWSKAERLGVLLKKFFLHILASWRKDLNCVACFFVSWRPGFLLVDHVAQVCQFESSSQCHFGDEVLGDGSDAIGGIVNARNAHESFHGTIRSSVRCGGDKLVETANEAPLSLGFGIYAVS